jgi:hypothetical protein
MILPIDQRISMISFGTGRHPTGGRFHFDGHGSFCGIICRFTLAAPVSGGLDRDAAPGADHVETWAEALLPQFV